jgi:hypothetical protein
MTDTLSRYRKVSKSLAELATQLQTSTSRHCASSNSTPTQHCFCWPERVNSAQPVTRERHIVGVQLLIKDKLAPTQHNSAQRERSERARAASTATATPTSVSLSLHCLLVIQAL